MYFLPEQNLHTLLGNLQEGYNVYLPEKKNNNHYYTRFDPKRDSYTIDEVRACEPLKGFFFKAREKVAENYKPGVPAEEPRPLCIVGVKACDLKGFKVQDYVFLTDEFTDPFYKRAREENLIISADCSCAIDTCFCMALSVKPYPEENYDLNLSLIENGCVVEVGSDKGEAVVKTNKELFQEVTSSQKQRRQQMRNQVQKEVQNNIKKYNIPMEKAFKDKIKKNYSASFWKPEAETCVECGACNTICPTCHCFLLYDQGDAKKMARLRVWDSCMIKDFARVAGGANPRPELWMRLRNRFEKKFDFFPKVLDLNACTGCGRCISACPAKIDIRKVLGRLAGIA
jgi:sulfhydrogenase subunit beta (sulfur reductase)